MIAAVDSHEKILVLTTKMESEGQCCGQKQTCTKIKKQHKNTKKYKTKIRDISHKLLTADPLRSPHPPKHDVDFFMCCGRYVTEAFKFDSTPLSDFPFVVHSTSY